MCVAPSAGSQNDYLSTPPIQRMLSGFANRPGYTVTNEGGMMTITRVPGAMGEPGRIGPSPSYGTQPRKKAG